MAAIVTASPTPLGAIHDEYNRKSMSRQNVRRQPSRPNLRRGSPISSKSVLNGSLLPQTWKFSMGDSSDDEIPEPPVKFSAEAKALLGDEASMIGGSSPSQPNESKVKEGESQEKINPVWKQSPVLSRTSARSRTASPASIRSGSPRVVRVSASTAAPSTLKRTTSTLNDNGSSQIQYRRDLITPAARPRNPQPSSPKTRSGSASVEAHGSSTAKPLSAGSINLSEPSSKNNDNSSIHEAATQMGNLSINKNKSEEAGAQGSVRIKRISVAGRYLSGPARRGMKRRQSDDDQSPVPESGLRSDGAVQAVDKQNTSDLPDPRSGFPPGVENLPNNLDLVQNQRPSHVRFQSQASIVTGSPVPSNKEPLKEPDHQKPEVKSKPATAVNREVSLGKPLQPVFKVPPFPLPSRFDQENEPPPTFKRNKANGPILSDRQKFSVMSDEKMLMNTPATATPQRPALAARSQNTPHRPAPPPPKMSMIETATATAGAASASQARRKRNYVSVNGKLFTRMDCIGRGGSSKVYRVMAENYKVFALKRVTLDDQDEMAIRGYKGEIDLLKKLENVDRVVRLFDWELNEEKRTLNVLMEMGESDLNRILTARLNAEDATFDVTFTRYFWKEMLECVQAVHQYDIVHSDLKPANFLLLQGNLKLIDFGISNAIADDTVNVHREQHIGTPNYMSPEALIDSNAGSGLPSSAGKIMKLGKPSDVWSLGCILYQMVYGKPPFAHIANQMQRIMAIPNPNHIIAFPATGVGGIAVSSGLIRTLKRCLNRDASQRPTVGELLAYGDPFLHPDVVVRDTVRVSQELLGKIQHNIIEHVKVKGIPSQAELAMWPEKFFNGIKAAVEEGKA